MNGSELERQVRARWDFDDPVTSFEVMTSAATRAADEVERAIWSTQAARALGLQERFDEAEAILDQIVDSLGSHVRARKQIERGRVHNSRGNPELARPLFDEALIEAEAAGVEGLAIDAMHMLAIVAGTATESERLNRAALARAEASQDPDARRWRASLLNNLGWNLFDAQDFEEALARFAEALALREAEGKESAIAAARDALAEARSRLG